MKNIFTFILRLISFGFSFLYSTYLLYENFYISASHEGKVGFAFFFGVLIIVSIYF